jgi:hypothetical protein
MADCARRADNSRIGGHGLRLASALGRPQNQTGRISILPLVVVGRFGCVQNLRGPVAGARLLIRFREWYGVQPGRPNVGLKMHAEKVGEGLAERESKDSRKPEYGVLDPSAFKEDGGPSIAERIANGSGIYFIPADNSRVPSRGAMGDWDQMRARLIGDNEGRPMVVCFSAGLTLPGPLSRISGLGRRIFSRPSRAR